MKNMIDFIESTKRLQRLSDQHGQWKFLTDSFFKEQQEWKKRYSAINMYQSFFNTFDKQHSITTKKLAGIDWLANSFQLPQQFNIPKTAIDAINSIWQQNDRLYGKINDITDYFKSGNLARAKFNNFQFALNAVSGQVAGIAKAQNRWDLLDELKNISEQSFQITNEITADSTLTEEATAQYANLIEVIFQYLKKNKKFATHALLFLSIIVNLMTVHQYIDFVKEKPALATKEDLGKFETKILKLIETKLIEEKEYRILNRVCKVMLKPKAKTFVLSALPAGFNVIVLQNNHKWSFISYSDPKDGLPQTGWVIKKYLNKPK